MARKAQPGLLIVDRTVKGTYENYQTPEQHIPDKASEYPWESCITLTNNWGYVPNDPMKPTTKVIQTLVEVVAKGGSLLLGVGPKPDGTLADDQVKRLAEIGDWLKLNGEAIYNTRIVKSFQSGYIFFTQNPTKKTTYAIVCLPENKEIPKSIEWIGNIPVKGSRMKFLANGAVLKWKVVNNKTIVEIPATVAKSIKSNTFAIVFNSNAE